jgi:hypothetical protein
MNTSGCKVPFCIESIMDLDKQQLKQRGDYFNGNTYVILGQDYD